MPCDVMLAAQWSSARRIYESAYVCVLSPLSGPEPGAGVDVVPASLITPEWCAALMSASPMVLLAPLFVGRLKQRPRFAPVSDMSATVSISLVEDSPWRFRLAPVAPSLAVPLDWPDGLDANWRKAPESATIDSVTYSDLGATRVRAVEGVVGVVRRTQKFQLSLEDREQVRLLLSFFLSRRGRVESFGAPWVVRPGEASAEMPHVTRARFAEDSLTLEFPHADAAEARVAFQQVPWEVSPLPEEAPAQPAEAFLYTFTLAIPGEPDPVTWRYTDWENNITWEGQTWLGDTSGLIEHDAITQTADLSDPATKITLSANVPGNPIALIASGALDAPLRLDIHSCVPHTAAGLTTANSVTPLYTGDVDEVSADGRKLTASTRVLGGLLENKVPGFPFSDTCNHRFCLAGCNLVAATWTLTGVIDSQAGSGLTLKNIANPNGRPLSDNFYARGILISAAGPDWEIRQILSNTRLAGDKMLLTLRSPLRNAPANLVVSFRPDCAGTPADCDARGNYINYGGHPHIGSDNLSLPSYNTTEAMGKK
jgi:hypothetical protein